MDMHSANLTAGEMLEQGELSGSGEALPGAAGSYGIMDVLLPAKPPEPKNPRIIRRFDLEAAKNDPRPGEPAPAPVVAAPKPANERLSREEAKALRNRSLLAAAGLV